MNQLYIIVKIQARDKCRVKAGVCVPARENNDWLIEQITMNITACMKYHQTFIFLNLTPWISKVRCPILFHLFEDQFFPPKEFNEKLRLSHRIHPLSDGLQPFKRAN